MKKYLIIVLMISCLNGYAERVISPTFTPRSQGCNELRNLAGMSAFNQYSIPQNDLVWYGNFSVGAEFNQSFFNDEIAASLFGNDIDCGSCDHISIEGSQVSSRLNNAWLADNLYLGCNYTGGFFFNPTIRNFIVNPHFYLGLDPFIENAYIQVNCPLTLTQWKTNFRTSDESPNRTACREGYFTPDGSETMLASCTDYFCGKVPTSNSSVIFQPLRFAKMKKDHTTKWGLADFHLEIGYSIIKNEKADFGLFAQLVAPTGNSRKATYVLNPVVGNGGHWEAGGGFFAHYLFYENESKELTAGFYSTLNMTHIFNAFEERTFDLTSRPNSRYMLASKFSSIIDDNLSGSNLPDTSSPTLVSVTNPSAQFTNEYSPVANLTSFEIKVKNAIQVDLNAYFNIIFEKFSFDFGYNFWTRSCDQFGDKRIPECPSSDQAPLIDMSQSNVWALKGDANMFGFATLNAGGLSVDEAVPLSPSQFNATIHSGTNSTASGSNPLLSNLGGRITIGLRMQAPTISN